MKKTLPREEIVFIQTPKNCNQCEKYNHTKKQCRLCLCKYKAMRGMV